VSVEVNLHIANMGVIYLNLFFAGRRLQCLYFRRNTPLSYAGSCQVATTNRHFE